MIGLGSIFYFVGLARLPVSVAVGASNAYIAVTVLLSILIVHDLLPLPSSPRGEIVVRSIHHRHEMGFFAYKLSQTSLPQLIVRYSPGTTDCTILTGM